MNLLYGHLLSPSIEWHSPFQDQEKKELCLYLLPEATGVKRHQDSLMYPLQASQYSDIHPLKKVDSPSSYCKAGPINFENQLATFQLSIMYPPDDRAMK